MSGGSTDRLLQTVSRVDIRRRFFVCIAQRGLDVEWGAGVCGGAGRSLLLGVCLGRGCETIYRRVVEGQKGGGVQSC